MRILIFIFFLISAAHAACLPQTQKYPVPGQDFVVSANSYSPSERTDTISTVLILPTILGEGQVERSFAQNLCSSGLRVLILDVVNDTTAQYQIDNLSSHDESFNLALAGVRAVMTSLKTDTTLNGKFGILGASQGGLFATFISGQEKDISAAVIIVGAANLPGVLTYSDQRQVRAIRTARKNKLGIRTDAEYEKILSQKISVDPASDARNIDPSSTYLFLAQLDSTVPYRYQKELANALTGSKIQELRLNHVNAIVRVSKAYQKNIAAFFESKL